MKKLYSLLFLYFLINLSFGQDKILSHFRIDANLNYLNKKRSYGVYSDDKYANSGHYLGLDFGLHYESKLIDYGI